MIPKLVVVATQEELRKFEKLQVYEIDNEEGFKRDPQAIKIGTKWMVTNKGTKSEPMTMGALVGKEYADDTKRVELFAGTPGRPALRYLVSKLATTTCGEERKCARVMDVTSALLYGRFRRPILHRGSQREDPRSQLDGVLAKKVESLYGTRDAPMIWQDCLRCQMKLLGFKESLRSPCMFHRETKGVEMIAHVDAWFRAGGTLQHHSISPPVMLRRKEPQLF